jgi:hypothetical protein
MISANLLLALAIADQIVAVLAIEAARLRNRPALLELIDRQIAGAGVRAQGRAARY